PADGSSSLAALPPLTGSVTGQVLAGDATTPVAGPSVTFHSNHPLFARTFPVTADGSGHFSFNGRINDLGSSVPIPVDTFTVQATHPQTGVRSPPAPGSFPMGQLAATQNIIFTN